MFWMMIGKQKSMLSLHGPIITAGQLDDEAISKDSGMHTPNRALYSLSNSYMCRPSYARPIKSVIKVRPAAEVDMLHGLLEKTMDSTGLRTDIQTMLQLDMLARGWNACREKCIYLCLSL